MQEEVTQKTIALSMKTGKLTAQVLQIALKKFLEAQKHGPKLHQGQQSLKQLKQHGAALSNIEITDANIAAFKPCAKKYSVDFALRKDKTTQPPHYIVIFKSRDADNLEQAFKEFTAKKLSREAKNGLEPIEKTVIDRAVQVIYRPYLADPSPEKMPALSDLHAALTAQHIPEADRVAQALDLYVSGSLNVFNHRTNVDIENRLVCFDIKDLGKQLKKLGMLIVQDQIWGRVTANRSMGKATWYFADEFHLLLKEEQTAAYSAEIWKRFRKWGGIPTGATQNVKDLLSSPEIENILENSDFITLLNQASGDRKILAERLNLSPDHQKYIDNSEPGAGLLIFGNVILPFTNPIPSNTELYKIMTTRLSEIEY